MWVTVVLHVYEVSHNEKKLLLVVLISTAGQSVTDMNHVKWCSVIRSDGKLSFLIGAPETHYILFRDFNFVQLASYC